MKQAIQFSAWNKWAIPVHAQMLRTMTRSRIVRNAKVMFPNWKMACYLARPPRCLTIPIRPRLNPEPPRLQSGFSVRWVLGIRSRVTNNAEHNQRRTGRRASAWLSWGATYLRADGSLAP